MNHPITGKILSCALLLGAAPLVSAESVARFYCDDDAEGAVIYINGKRQGNCPDDVFLQPGKTSIRVVKPAGAGKERVYQQTRTVKDDDILRINVSLSAPRLTAAAIEQQLVLARKGNKEAMQVMADAYQNGTGVAKNTAKADYWRQQIAKLEQIQARIAAQSKLEIRIAEAQAGDLAAQLEVAAAYASGEVLDKDDTKAKYWYQQAFANAEQKAKAPDAKAEDMTTLARMYTEGNGVAANPEQAQYWSQKASDQTGRAEAEAQLAYRKTQYFPMTKELTYAIITDGKDNPAAMITSLPISGAVFLLVDLFIANPISGSTHATEYYEFRQKYGNVAQWENPNAMVAQSTVSR